MGYCIGGNITIDGNLKLEMNRSESASHLEYQPKSALEKLVYVVMFKACFQTVEG
jgi:hypothetical protein